MKIVFLDRETVGHDIDTTKFREFGELVEYDTTNRDQVKEYIKDANVIIFNKTVMNEDMLVNAKELKLICVTATGFDNIDLDYCRKNKIACCNVVGYSTPSVVQHTFASTLYILEKLDYYDKFVKSEEYANQSSFTNFSKTFYELEGKTWGIIGMGNIGKKVAEVARTFGANVITHSITNKDNKDYKNVSFDDLLNQSDILSLHCPLSDLSRNLINLEALKKMKSNAILVNVARGPVVNDADLYYALENNLIYGAALDVLTNEPMAKDNPLINFKDSNRLLITPHIAWASYESRSRCLSEIYENIHSFIKGDRRNRLD